MKVSTFKSTKNGKSTTIVEYASINEFYDYVMDTPINKSFFGERLSSQQTGWGAKSFTGTETFDEAVDLLKNGWSEMASKITKVLKKPSDGLAKTSKSRNVNAMAGFQPIVPLYLNGCPANMASRKSVPVKDRVVTVNKSISYAANVSTEKIEEESIKALQLVQQLEGQGTRVNLNVVLGTYQGGGSFLVKVRIKNSTDKLNISKMSFPLVHPAMLRRLFFKFVETYPEIPSSFVGSYGMPLDESEIRAMVTEAKEHLIPKHLVTPVEKIKDIKDIK